jgi:hypothetical protein
VIAHLHEPGPDLFGRGVDRDGVGRLTLRVGDNVVASHRSSNLVAGHRVGSMRVGRRRDERRDHYDHRDEHGSNGPTTPFRSGVRIVDMFCAPFLSMRSPRPL